MSEPEEEAFSPPPSPTETDLPEEDPKKDFIQDVMATEEEAFKKSFSKEFAHSDKNQKYPTTITCSNADYTFVGAVQSLRIKYRSKVNYSSGFAVLQTKEDIVEKENKGSNYYRKSDYGRPDKKEREHIAILPLATFLAFFRHPASLAEVLTARANSIVRAWNEKNSHSRMQGKRRHLTVTWTLAEYTWRNSKGKEETSQYTFQISTFGYTNANQQTKRPVITIKDLKSFFKLRSTTTGSGPEAGKSPRYDSYGFACLIVHLIGLLRSKEFPKFIADVETLEASIDSEEPQAKKKRGSEVDEAVVVQNNFKPEWTVGDAP